MPVKPKRIPNRRDWTDDHLCQLRWGHDFFNVTDWSDPLKLREAGRDADADAWPSPEVLEDMRRCWTAHREQILAAHNQHYGLSPQPVPRTWAEKVFDDGMAPMAALMRDNEPD